jgi:hypothetical protein
MKDVGNFSMLFLSVKPVDFRNQAYGLARLVKDVFGEQPLNSKALLYIVRAQHLNIISCCVIIAISSNPQGDCDGPNDIEKETQLIQV